MIINEQRGNVLHGILLIALFSFSAFYIAEFDFVRKLSFSPLIVGILLGMVYANSLRNHLPETWVPGIRFCSKQLLRLGIVLYGFRLTFAQVAAIGLPAIAVDAVVVVATLLLGVALGRLMKMDADTALMTATGSSICGAAAVLGAEGVVRCEPHKTAVAVSTVVIFGTVSLSRAVAQRPARAHARADGRVHRFDAARGGPRGGGRQRHGARDRRCGHHHQDDPRDDAGARAAGDELLRGAARHGGGCRGDEAYDRRSVVRVRLPGRPSTCCRRPWSRESTSSTPSC